MSLKSNKNITSIAILIMVGGLLAQCEKSPLGPQINVQPLPSDVSPISVANPVATGDTGRSDSSTPAAISPSTVCAAQPKRLRFYTGSNISLNFSCNMPVTEVTSTSLPAFLTLTPNVQSLTATGTAPSSPASYSWSFAPVNREGGAVTTSVTIDVLHAQALASTLNPPSAFDSSNNQGTSNGVEFD